MQLNMITLPQPGDVLTPQFYGNIVQIRANMAGTTGTGTVIAEGHPRKRYDSQDYREYDAEISAPVHATIDLLVEHYGCVDDRDETEQTNRAEKCA